MNKSYRFSILATMCLQKSGVKVEEDITERQEGRPIPERETFYRRKAWAAVLRGTQDTRKEQEDKDPFSSDLLR